MGEWEPELLVGAGHEYPTGIVAVKPGERVRYVPERTCRNIDGNGWFECSECGRRYIPSQIVGKGSEQTGCEWSYCPSCGAKVVGE